jgi:predicted Zn-dependent protease
MTKQADENQFSDAERLAASQNKDEAREAYRKAFDALLNDPLHGEITAADLAAYVQAVREEEPLDKITPRLWTLRDKLRMIASEPNSANAGEARQRISVLQGVMIESVGSILKNNATDDEVKAVFEDLSKRIDMAPAGPDGLDTQDVILNISRKAGLGMLEEKALQKRLKDAPADMRSPALRNLVDFYDGRGAYARSFEAIERVGSNDNPFVAEHARLVGNTDKELAALRLIYEKPSDKPAITPDASVARYLDLLYANDRDELKAICGSSSSYQLQLINFLLSKGEHELTHLAIENSNLPMAWKISRSAETSLAFREYGDKPECYFCDALQFDTIGNMINQPPDKQRFLVGDDWFRLTHEYGEWLFYSPQKSTVSSMYLAAMIELRPHSAEAQDRLGTFYLDEKQATAALEHFRIAYELGPNDTTIASDLGASYYIGGNHQNADEMWRRALDGASPEEMSLFFASLSHFGLANEARSRLSTKIVDFLKKNNVNENNEEIEKLISSIAASFDDKRAEASYFAMIMSQRQDDTSLAEFLLNGSLIDKQYSDPFYERLISKTNADEIGDYEFKSAIDRAWSYDDAEWIYDQESEYKTAEPDGEHYKWRQKYIESLIDRHEDAKAAVQINALETELRGQYAHPASLRIAELQMALRGHNFVIASAERFIGITVNASVKEVNAPDIDRYNEVVKMLRSEKAAAAEQQLAQAFFARNLALGQYDEGNFDGFARSLLQAHVPTAGTRILQLMVNAANEETRPIALAELDELPEVKAHVPDSSDVKEASINYSTSDALDLAARTSTEFGLREAAIRFRRELLDVQPRNAENRLDLAELLVGSGNKTAAMDLLNQLAADGNSSRNDRWQAKWHAYKIDPKTELPDLTFDSLSQFYAGLEAVGSAENASEDDFLNSLIDSNDPNNAAADKLIEIYAASDKQYAALKLADAFKHDRPDSLNMILSKAAEEIGQFERAIAYERSKSDGGDHRRLEKLRQLQQHSKTRTVDLTVDPKNTGDV